MRGSRGGHGKRHDVKMGGESRARARTGVARARATVALLAALLPAGGMAAAAEGGATDRPYAGVGDKWQIRLGGYLADFTTDAAIGSDSGVGISFRAEDELNVDADQNVLAVSGFFRFNPKHSIAATFWTLNRDGEAVIDEDLEINGVLYSLGAEVDSAFDTSLLSIFWGYTLFHTDRGEAGFLLGLSAYDFDLAFEGIATVSDGMGGTTTEFVATEESLVAPLPTVGMFMQYAFAKKWLMRVQASWLDLQVSGIEGKITQFATNFEWRFSRHVGVGVGVNRADISVVDSGDDPFAFDFDQSGLFGYFTFGK